MKLSILICSLESRYKKLFGLIDMLVVGGPAFEVRNIGTYAIQTYQSSDFEIIAVTDNKQMSVGAKRNLLLSLATGDYIVYVDDDDKVSQNYASVIMGQMHNNPDVIVFDAVRYHNGKFDRRVRYGCEFNRDYNTPECYYRIPNHLMCVKRELALKVPFKEISFGEDADYAQRLLPLLKTQARINEVLYEYWFDDKLTETGNRK